jgi:long-chain acyl-CoA synthetase
VVQRYGKLKALIVPDEDVVKALNLTDEGLAEKLENYRKELNKHFPSYMAVAEMLIHKEPFEKTPKQSIKRFMYQ